MTNDREVAIGTTDVLGRDIVCFQTTFELHQLKHPEPFTENDIKLCLEDPDMIAKTGHTISGHKHREIYYRNKQFKNAPSIMKVIVDHQVVPGIVTSMFRTSKYTKDGVIVHIRKGYLEGKHNADPSTK